MLRYKMEIEGYDWDTREEEFLTELGKLFCRDAEPLESLNVAHLESWVASIKGVRVLMPFTRAPTLMITFETQNGRAIVMISGCLGGVFGFLTWEDIDGIENLKNHRAVIPEREPKE